MSKDRYLPLAGVRVLDLSRLLVGAIVTRHLADLGADVVKVEDPTIGDYLRAIPPHVDGEGIWHHTLDRNKRSIALDIPGNADHRAIVAQLMEVADVVIDVSRAGSLQRLGFDIPDLRRRRPEVVVCSISGFGQTGEWATVPAHGMNLDCLAGTVATRTADNGEDEIVQAVYVSLGQVFGALNAVIATTAAIVGARATGEGAWIDISCWDALMEVNSTAVAYQAVTGRDAQVDMGHMWGSMHRIYRAKDGVKVFVALIEQKFWQTFCNEVDRQDLIDKWQDHGGLDYGDMALVAELEPIMASRTGAEWESFFLRLGLPASPIYSTQDVIDSAHFETRGMLEWTEGDPIPNVASGIRWIDSNGDRPGARPRPAPSVGQHTDEVLSSWLGQG